MSGAGAGPLQADVLVRRSARVRRPVPVARGYSASSDGVGGAGGADSSDDDYDPREGRNTDATSPGAPAPARPSRSMSAEDLLEIQRFVGEMAGDLRREQALLEDAATPVAALRDSSCRVAEIFERLRGLVMTTEALRATGTGLLVNKLRKMPALQHDARALGRGLVRGWKHLIDSNTMPAQMMGRAHRLPQEMLVQVFGHLDTRTVVMILPRVCRRWREACGALVVPRFDLAWACKLLESAAELRSTKHKKGKKRGALLQAPPPRRRAAAPPLPRRRAARTPAVYKPIPRDRARARVRQTWHWPS